MGVLHGLVGKTMFSPRKTHPTEKPVKKFATDRFDQYLTRCATDGILLGEV
jgi:hypothetical protein